MTQKKDQKPELTTGAFVNWEEIARFLGQPVEKVRAMELEPTVATPAPAKR